MNELTIEDCRYVWMNLNDCSIKHLKLKNCSNIKVFASQHRTFSSDDLPIKYLTLDRCHGFQGNSLTVLLSAAVRMSVKVVYCDFLEKIICRHHLDLIILKGCSSLEEIHFEVDKMVVEDCPKLQK